MSCAWTRTHRRAGSPAKRRNRRLQWPGTGLRAGGFDSCIQASSRHLHVHEFTWLNIHLADTLLGRSTGRDQRSYSAFPRAVGAIASRVRVSLFSTAEFGPVGLAFLGVAVAGTVRV